MCNVSSKHYHVVRDKKQFEQNLLLNESGFVLYTNKLLNSDHIHNKEIPLPQHM